MKFLAGIETRNTQIIKRMFCPFTQNIKYEFAVQTGQSVPTSLERMAKTMKIAIEHDLTPVKYYLSTKGYDVECIDFNGQPKSKLQNYDAIVVTGLNSNALGNQTTKTSAVVINADGLTPEEVVQELETRYKNK